MEQGDGELMFVAGNDIASPGAGEHQDRFAHASGAQLHSLFDGGDAEVVRAGSLEDGCDERRAVSVGVGFDNGQHGYICRHSGAHSGEIGAQRGGVDGGEGWTSS
jgi:hypothetical protein